MNKEKGKALVVQGWNRCKTAGRKAGLAAVAIGATAVAFAPGASMAQGSSNEGIAAVKTAIDALKPDLGTIVLAAIAVALVGIGASVAMAIGKRLMGK